jgi:ADP-dependent phosphofructokinase/glucokinase
MDGPETLPPVNGTSGDASVIEMRGLIASPIDANLVAADREVDVTDRADVAEVQRVATVGRTTSRSVHSRPNISLIPSQRGDQPHVTVGIGRYLTS